MGELKVNIGEYFALNNDPPSLIEPENKALPALLIVNLVMLSVLNNISPIYVPSVFIDTLPPNRDFKNKSVAAPELNGAILAA